ncbi:MAG: DUF2189 domain-containing protein [Rhodocyclaceae bacterium]|nr:DUF2189 domain-containing protein [Rhodocyclaceae bacterium]
MSDASSPQAEPQEMSLSPRQVSLGAPFLWLKDGFRDLCRAQFASLFYGVCYALMGWTIAFFNGTSYGLTLAAASAFMLLGPILAIGLYDLSNDLEKSEPPDLRKSLTCWRPNISNLALFALVCTIVALIWARASAVIFAVFYNTGLPEMADFARAIVSLENIEFIVIYFGIGLVFATFIFAISVVSVPLMYDRKTDAITAALTSLAVVAKNPGPMVVWAVILVTLITVGFLTGFLGLIYTAPIAGHATWHAYKSLVRFETA